MGRRAKWKIELDAIGQSMYDRARAMSDAELRAFKRSLSRVPATRTNCWWLSAHLVAPMLDVVGYEQQQRKYAKKKARQ